MEYQLALFRSRWIDKFSIRVTRFMLILGALIGTVVYVKGNLDKRIKAYRDAESRLEIGKLLLGQGMIDTIEFYDRYQQPFMVAGVNLYGEEVIE